MQWWKLHILIIVVQIINTMVVQVTYYYYIYFGLNYKFQNVLGAIYNWPALFYTIYTWPIYDYDRTTNIIILCYLSHLQVPRRLGFGIPMSPSGMDKNATGLFSRPPEFRRRNADFLLFRLDNKTYRTQTLHVTGFVRIYRPIFFLFHHDESRLGAFDRNPKRHGIRIGPSSDGIVLKKDITTKCTPHSLRTRRTFRLHR